jgi:hypothetical protein
MSRLEPSRGYMATLSATEAPSQTKHPTSTTPNPSLERTSTGKALGPRTRGGYHRARGPSASPVAAPQLKR